MGSAWRVKEWALGLAGVSAMNCEVPSRGWGGGEGGMEGTPGTPTCTAEAAANAPLSRVSAFFPRYLLITVSTKGKLLP